MEKNGVLNVQEDLLESYKSILDWNSILEIRQRQLLKMKLPRIEALQEAVERLPIFKSKHIEFKDFMEIGKKDEFKEEDYLSFKEVLKMFIPWKKGPFHLFDIPIDAEWRSDWKWNRVYPYSGLLKGKKIADIGCNNGYFMFRMAEHMPEMVIGFEPWGMNLWNFHLIQNYAQIPSLQFELLGVEHIHHFPKFFDIVYCMGVLYHHTDPVILLRKIYDSLVPGGILILECQGIEGDLPVSLVPHVRYAHTKAIWNLPTVSCLLNWLHRTEFKRAHVFFNEYLSIEEQRSTSWAPIQSLKDFLDPMCREKTIEGYPAPRRIYIKAVKP